MLHVFGWFFTTVGWVDTAVRNAFKQATHTCGEEERKMLKCACARCVNLNGIVMDAPFSAP